MYKIYKNKMIFSFIIGLFIYSIIIIFNIIDLNSTIFNFDIYNFMGENDKTEVKVTEVTGNSASLSGNTNNANISLNDPRLSVNVNANALRHTAAALSSVGGAKIGLEVAKNMPGPPVVKVVAGVGTFLAVQGTTAVLSKVIGSDSDGSNNSNNFLPNLNNDYNSTDILSIFNNNTNLNSYTEFPLNLLVEVDKFIFVELLFISIIINVFIVNKLIELDIIKYLPDNKFGKLLKLFINRYISIWSKSNKYITIYSFVLLTFCIIMTRICFYFIAHY
jgi:hypothetical protein